MGDFYNKHPWMSNIAIGLVILVVGYFARLILNWIWPGLLYPVPFFVVALLIIGALAIPFIVRCFRKKHRERLLRSESLGPLITAQPINGILWEYSDDLMTDDRGLQIEKPICPNCKNELRFLGYQFHASLNPPREVAVVPQFICGKCHFSRPVDSGTLDEMKKQAQQEIERRIRVGEGI